VTATSRPAWLRWLRDLWERAKREHSTPREIALSVGVGAFVACSPFVGFHLGIAAALATLFRLNRLWAMIGSRLSTTPVFLATTFSEIQIAHRLRTGAWATLKLHEAMREAPQLVVDWSIGFVVVGGFVATLVGFVAYAVARRWQQTSSREPAALPRPSSESPR
jgi:uncharacterized protein (DUF2062 family)